MDRSIRLRRENTGETVRSAMLALALAVVF